MLIKVFQKSENEIRDLRNGNWYWIERGVLERYGRQIRALGIAVYNALAFFSNQNQKAFPSQKHIADLLGSSRSSINRAIKLLEENGLIRKERKGRRNCVYYLLKV